MEGRDVSWRSSFALPFDELPSREREALTGLVRVLLVLADSVAVPENIAGSCAVSARLLWPDCADNCAAFCFAALTLALDRMGLLSGIVSG